MDEDLIVSQRGRPRSPDLDDRIADAAWALLSEVPYEDVTFERVAERAGCTRPTIYRRHPSKQSMILAAINRILRRVEPVLGPAATARETIIEHLGSLVRYMTGGGGRSTLSLAQAQLYDLALREALKELRMRETKYYVDALKMACGPLLRPETCDLVIDSIIGAVIYRCVLRHEAINPDEIERLADLAIMIASQDGVVNA